MPVYIDIKLFIFRLLMKLNLVSNGKYLHILRQYQIIKNLDKVGMVITDTVLLGERFFFEPLRTSLAELNGSSGLIKMLDRDYYGLEHLDDQEPVIMDVGSHIGIFPRVIKSRFPSATIYSLEPDKDNYVLLKLNNDYLKDVHSFQLAVFDEESSISLKVSDQNSWRSTLSVNNDFFRPELIGGDNFSVGEYQVKCIPIDSFVGHNGISKLSLLGITVPGEIGLRILKGAQNTLEKLKPIVSIVVYDSEVADIDKYMINFGYGLLMQADSSMRIYLPQSGKHIR